MVQGCALIARFQLDAAVVYQRWEGCLKTRSSFKSPSQLTSTVFEDFLGLITLDVTLISKTLFSASETLFANDLTMWRFFGTWHLFFCFARICIYCNRRRCYRIFNRCYSGTRIRTYCRVSVSCSRCVATIRLLLKVSRKNNVSTDLHIVSRHKALWNFIAMFSLCSPLPEQSRFSAFSSHALLCSIIFIKMLQQKWPNLLPPSSVNIFSTKMLFKAPLSCKRLQERDK